MPKKELKKSNQTNGKKKDLVKSTKLRKSLKKFIYAQGVNGGGYALKLLAPINSKRRQYVKQIINLRRIEYNKNKYYIQRAEYYNVQKRYSLRFGPVVSIVVPAYNTPTLYLEPLLDSIFAQGYENWELILVDASDNEMCSTGIQKRAQSDSRITYIKCENKGIAVNTNVGIKKARGEFIAFLDHDDTLDPDALARTMQLFIDKPNLDLVYTDEDKISDNGDRYFEPHYKPDFSLDMLRSVNYITHFVIVRTSIAKELLIRQGFEGAQDYDFLLRVVDSGAEIGHVAGISYHWRQTPNSTAENFSNKKHVTDAGVKALKDHYNRRKIDNVSVSAIEDRPGFYKAGYKLNDGKKRAICITIPDQKEENINITDMIVDIYKKNKDVLKGNYDVVTSITESQKNTYKSILYVNDIILPPQDFVKINNLFALAEEDGVFGVTPRVVSSGQIYDIGLVKHDNRLFPLGKNTCPADFSVFGSHEWSRNVDGLTGLVVAVSSQDAGEMVHSENVRKLSIASPHRKIVCGDVEFIKLYSINTNNESSDINYFSHSLGLSFTPVVVAKQYIEETIENEK